jgi:hypothetical protein
MLNDMKKLILGAKLQNSIKDILIENDVIIKLKTKLIHHKV